MAIERQVKLEKLTQVCDFVNLASKYSCDVKVKSNNQVVDGKSILGILTLSLWKPVTVWASGEDAEEFVAQLGPFQPQ
ncbi:MAG: phosphocarrier protein HPr [Clostridiales bacterium]|nr:phosphocarrier protein HPr [Clostridiales bacterium]